MFLLDETKEYFGLAASDGLCQAAQVLAVF